MLKLPIKLHQLPAAESIVASIELSLIERGWKSIITARRSISAAQQKIKQIAMDLLFIFQWHTNWDNVHFTVGDFRRVGVVLLYEVVNKKKAKS